MKSDIRYYMGRHRIVIIQIEGRKAYIIHLESGEVGNKREGYKEIKKGDFDIVLTRFCYRKKKNCGVII